MEATAEVLERAKALLNANRPDEALELLARLPDSGEAGLLRVGALIWMDT